MQIPYYSSFMQFYPRKCSFIGCLWEIFLPPPSLPLLSLPLLSLPLLSHPSLPPPFPLSPPFLPPSLFPPSPLPPPSLPSCFPFFIFFFHLGNANIQKKELDEEIMEKKYQNEMTKELGKIHSEG